YWYEHKDKPIRHQRRKAIPKQNLVNIRKDVPLVWRERSVDVPTEMHLPNGKTWKGAITVQLPNREGIRERVKQKFPTLPDSAVEAQVDRFIGMWIRKELKVAYKLKTEVPKARRLVLPDEIDMT
ncbi:hypothetical protein GWN42_19560, partial [candidate division KSB1 bacterium]|nr:hypothetical protein [Phycisphaerae bacterium]NIV94923.1 hypothetical protein [candidate division KSB1 bacterium]